MVTAVGQEVLPTSKVSQGAETLVSSRPFRIARSLDVIGLQFQDREEGEEKVIRVVNGREVISKTPINTPFSATLSLITNSQTSKVALRSLGLNNSISNALVTFHQDGVLDVRGTFAVPYESPVYESQFVSSWKAGDEIAPYCFADEDGSHYQDVLVGHKTEYSTQVETAKTALSDESAMATILASLRASDKDAAQGLLGFLEENFPSEVAAGRKIVAAESKDEVAATVAMLEEQIAKLAEARDALS